VNIAIKPFTVRCNRLVIFIKPTFTRIIMRKAFILSSLVAVIGLSFKQMHWPGGSMIVLIGLVALAVTLIVSGVKAMGKTENRPLNGAERIISAFLLIGLFFKLQHWPGAGVILVLTLSTLSIMYWGGTWLLLGSGQAKEVKPNLVGFVLGFSYSVLAIGILFQLQNWPGGRTQILVGLIASALCHVWHWYSVKNDDSSYVWYTDIGLRVIWLFGLGILFAL